jgi:hypothetical protein
MPRKSEVIVGAVVAGKVSKPVPTLADDAQYVLERAKATTVRTVAEAEAATALLKDVRAIREKWSNHQRPVVDSAFKSYKTSLEAYNRLEKPLKAAEDRLKQLVGSFTLAARRAVERAVQATSAVAQRQNEAALSQHAESLQEAALAAVEARQTEIAAAEASGDIDKAERLRQLPVDVPVAAEPGLPAIALGPGTLEQAVQPDGMTVGEDWDFEITAPDQVPDQFWSVDPKKIKAHVAILKGATVIPGVRVFAKPKVSMR